MGEDYKLNEWFKKVPQTTLPTIIKSKEDFLNKDFLLMKKLKISIFILINKASSCILESRFN